MLVLSASRFSLPSQFPLLSPLAFPPAAAAAHGFCSPARPPLLRRRRSGGPLLPDRVAARDLSVRRSSERSPSGLPAARDAMTSEARSGAACKAPSVVEIGGFSVEGISIGGHETCVMIPSMRMAFDIGRCPQRAISQDFLFISHAHMDHIGGIAMYVATRGLYRMRPPTVIVPKSIKATVEKLLEVYRELDASELAIRLVGLDVGEEYDLGKGYMVKPFRTYHVISSQGYVIYSVKKKLKPEYLSLLGPEIKRLRLSGVEIVTTTLVPEVAFTGDTTADFIVDEANTDALRAKLLIMEATFVDKAMSISHARDYGHVHLSEVAALADRFENQNILFIHFSARYETQEILTALQDLPEVLKGRVAPLLNGF